MLATTPPFTGVYPAIAPLTATGAVEELVAEELPELLELLELELLLELFELEEPEVEEVDDPPPPHPPPVEEFVLYTA